MYTPLQPLLPFEKRMLATLVTFLVHRSHAFYSVKQRTGLCPIQIVEIIQAV